MRTLKILSHVSLDGVVQAPGGRGEGGDDYPYGGWSAPFGSPAGAQAVADVQGKRFDLLLGRRTYDIFAGHWPKAAGPLADGLNAATKYVATHRPEGLAWGPVGTLGTDVVKGIRSVKSADGPDLIVWGSGTLTTLLLDEGLVDEMVLLVYPVLLGQGKRLFQDGARPRELAIVDTKALPSGVFVNRYRYVGPARS